MKKEMSMNATAWAMLLLLSLVWGGSFFFTAVAVPFLPPLTIVIIRVGLAAVALNIIIFALGGGLPFRRAEWPILPIFFGMGALNNVIPFSLIVWGQGHIPGGLAAILNATTPLFGVVVAHFLTANEKITAARLFGVIAGFVGVAVMLGGDLIGEADGTGVVLWAQIAVLGAACSYAFASVFGLAFRRRNIPPLSAAAGQVSASTLLLLPLWLFIDRPWALSAPPAEAVAALVGLALLSTAFAYLLFFRILAMSGATNVTLVTFLVPLSAIFLGALFLGEQLETRHAVGMVLIGVGLAAIDGRCLRQFKGPR